MRTARQTSTYEIGKLIAPNAQNTNSYFLHVYLFTWIIYKLKTMIIERRISKENKINLLNLILKDVQEIKEYE